MDFKVEVDQLSMASIRLKKVSDKVGEAQNVVKECDIGAFFGAFGRELGLDRVARAYDEHQQLTVALLVRLQESSLAASEALGQVVDLYRQSDQL